MANYSIVLFILLFMVTLSVFSNRLKVPYPILLVLTGVVVGLIPSWPYIKLDPEVVFLIFLPPLLYDSAFNISFKSFRENFSTIRTLAFPLVFFTATGIAIFARFIIPGMTWPLAFVLGAILSATDAVAAIGITKNLGLSHKTVTILEGESLINDASALIVYRFAIAALTGTAFVLWKAAWQFAVVLVGGFLVGFIIARLVALVVQKVKSNSVITISFMLLAPFVTYLIAEELRVSGVIALVVMGFGMSWFSKLTFTTQQKHEYKTIWEVITFLLNGFIFVLIGLQFPYILHNIELSDILPYSLYAFLITILIFIIRFAWIFVQRKHLEEKLKQHQENKTTRKGFKRFGTPELLDLQTSIIVCWGGIRGIIPLAIALGLPETLGNYEPFPQRNAIIYISSMVVMITIVGQGLILPKLVKKLNAKSSELPAN